ncbi:MAG: DUF4158 domain-containing protein [Gammaproteobacteria bacterium]|nr:DUF4158 domain-containing protein [Gammaproteobacteria bacterium]
MEIYNLDEDEIQLIKSKHTNKNKLAFAILLKYFQLEGHYPKDKKVLDPTLINSLVVQLNISPCCIENFTWEGRSIEQFRHEIRNYLGFKEATLGDAELLKAWLIHSILPEAPTIRQCTEYAYHYFKADDGV